MKKLFVFFAFALLAVQVSAQEIKLAPGQKQVVRLDEAYHSSENSNKAVAFTTGKRSRNVVIQAQREGTTNIQLFAKNGGLIRQFNVVVGNGAPSIAARVEPTSGYDAWQNVKSLFPKENIKIQSVGNGLALIGTVSDAATAAQIVQVAEQVSGNKNVINLMQVKSGQQVMLRVRIGEVQRGAMDQLGLSAQGVVGAVSGLFYSNTLYDVDTRLDFLSQNGLMKTLAEPNLTAISGEKAKFLAGGEVPITVAQKGGDVFTTEYKSFGVGVQFTPTVLANNRIRLAVEPEVSEVAKSSVSKGAPTFSTRRAQTTVELAPGESFMIAGLISDNLRNVSDEMPVAGDIPVLGALFRSTAFKRNETELVIAVTPYLVDPVPAQDIKLPTDNFKPASVLEQYFFGAISSKPNVLGVGGVSDTPQPEGKHGFMTE